jgi:uncharacterized protein YejL (UPF0352 family)
LHRIAPITPLALAALALFAGMLAPQAQADPIVLAASLSNGSTGGDFTTSSQPTAQQFTLNQVSTLSSIDAMLSNYSTQPGYIATASDLTLTIYGNTVSNQINTSMSYGTSSNTTGTLGQTASDINFAFGNNPLAAGTYWAELNTSVGYVPWETQQALVGTNNSSATGSINSVNYNSGSYSTTVLVMTVNGNVPSAVPEPSSLAMCCLAGLIGSAYARRRRQRVAIA